MRQSWETMTSVSAGPIILTPTQLVGSGRPRRESNAGPPHQDSRALPTVIRDIYIYNYIYIYIYIYIEREREREREGGRERGGGAERCRQIDKQMDRGEE